MKDPIVYVLVPVETEVPKETMFDVCIIDFEGEFQHFSYYETRGFVDKYDNSMTDIVTHWLKPVPLENILKEFSKSIGLGELVAEKCLIEEFINEKYK